MAVCTQMLLQVLLRLQPSAVSGMFRFSLPYKHLLPAVGEASEGDMWNCEMSLLDGNRRSWMLGPMYNMQTGQLMVRIPA